jgi:hypothetical protein
MLGDVGHDRDRHIRGRHRHHARLCVPRIYLAWPVMTDNDRKVLDEILTCGNSQHTGQDIRRSLDDFGFEIRKRSIFERVLKVFMESNLDISYWDDDCKVELAEAVAKELDPNG